MTSITDTLAFAEFNQPPLESGTYAVTVSQTVAGGSGGNAFSETFSTTLDFAVAGARFALPQGAVVAQFPPAGGQGDFSSVLPHVLLADSTLPWQRSSGYGGGSGSPYKGYGGNDPKVYPWLALLSFDAADPVPVIRQGSVADLSTNLPAGTTSYPGLQLEVGEAATDPCCWVDVPAALFTAIAPSAEDMRWLAHVRAVSTATPQPGNPAGNSVTSYSAVIANRLPIPGDATTCMLVSLEGMSAILPGAGAPPGGTVRLAVLASWSFACQAGTETFQQYFSGLGITPSTLQVPYADAGGSADAAVQEALAMGYTAIDHATREGSQTVSWYRGPLLPFARPMAAALPAPAADALTAYDPATGMFDVSLSLAWQWGQLAALADKGFATQLYGWTRQQATQTVAAYELSQLIQSLGGNAATGDGQSPLGQAAAALVPTLTTFLSKGA